MKPFPRKCVDCRQRTVSPVILPSHQETLEHDGRKYTVVLEDFPVQQCANCGAMIFDEASNDRLVAALREAAELLTPEEIRQQREALKLTQKQLASHLRVSESTLSRWETGAQIQQRAMDLLLRLFFGLKEVRRFLGAPEHTWQAPAVEARSTCSQTNSFQVVMPVRTRAHTPAPPVRVPATVSGNYPVPVREGLVA
jgi:putative zinc finger/helix-turn-helix YgiT family protein